MIPADTYTSTVIYERLNDVLLQEVIAAQSFPVTNQQAEDLALGITIRIPG